MKNRLPIIAAVIVVLIVIGGVWFWITSGRESTDDAQVDAHVTPIAARVGGTVLTVPVKDNQQVEAGAVLVQIDTRDYQIALDKARADLADAEAAAEAARANVPITSTSAAETVTGARGGVEQAQAAIDEAERGIVAARARVASAQAQERQAQANATKTAKDVERLRSLLAKDEISQQQFDAASAAADAAKAAADAAASQVAEAEAGIKVAESKLAQAKVSGQQAVGNLHIAQTGPQQVQATKARADAADAHVKQLQATVQQAELNLQYATVKAPVKGIVSKKTVEVGQVIQPGQPLMTIIPLEQVWITANFKETQLDAMRPGQKAKIDVDAYGGTTFTGHVDSIAAATGARFSLLPPENATGNFVKVVQRVPVKIVLDAGQDPSHLLRPGMSVTPTVYTK
jgi:membrane fusion protein (multidrug efflux system)